MLVADDAAEIRDLYSRYLSFRGLRVITAEDGVSALQAVSAEHPDVVLVDLVMPRQNGWQLIQTLRAGDQTRAVPIIAVSGLEERESALAAGADAYFEKPCPLEDVLREALRLLRGTRSRRDQ